MLTKISTTALGLCFAAMSLNFAHAHDASVQVANYSWSKEDSTVHLEIPYSTDSELESGIQSRLDAFGQSIFGDSFYMPKGSKDSQFASKMAGFYSTQQKTSSKAEVQGPVLQFSLKTKLLSNTADMVSIQMTADSMVKGAAHPATGVTFINVNPTTKTFYDDLSFLSSSQQQTVLADLYNALKKKLGSNLLLDKSKLASIVSNTFNITSSSIDFTFQPAIVAPSYFGPVSVSVANPAASTSSSASK